MPSVMLEDISPTMQELFWELVEKSAANLNNHQQQKLFTLLLSFADVFALCNDDLERTNKLFQQVPTSQFVKKLEGFHHFRRRRSIICYKTCSHMV